MRLLSATWQKPKSTYFWRGQQKWNSSSEKRNCVKHAPHAVTSAQSALVISGLRGFRREETRAPRGQKSAEQNFALGVFHELIFQSRILP
jgi:hypothetical protein